LVGMETLMMAMITDLDAVKAVIAMVTDYTVRMSRRMVEAGLEMCWLTDDYGSERALMISPAMWRTLFKPALAEIFSVWKDAGRMVGLHSCGSISAIVGDLVEIGLDVLHPVQASCNDAAALKAQWGDRLSFWGGVSSRVLMTGAPDDVRRETLRMMAALGPGGGYVCGQDQTMPYPEENLRVLAETVEEFGAYPLRLPAL
jgi:uroporphyrinogen decarboxylase